MKTDANGRGDGAEGGVPGRAGEQRPYDSTESRKLQVLKKRKKQQEGENWTVTRRRMAKPNDTNRNLPVTRSVVGGGNRAAAWESRAVYQKKQEEGKT